MASDRFDILFVLGGARSGKSAYAEMRARQTGLDPIYLATAQALDEEMRDRVARHREDRASDGWKTIEEPLALTEAIGAETDRSRVLLVDCLTLWVSNLMLAERDIPNEIERLISRLRKGPPGPIVFVSNETGLGIVPDNAMARAFRDHAGRLNQRIAAMADEVVFVAAGLPLVLKTAR
ncbi:adenosylcobinamide kinase [Fulvimarina pelagi HTCC2506]|uniref:Bifunctional adenosylcobalamin biosynthesis protein n=2 Tax=Fulvimarina pelagi TaxID=217511 RepID=Q0G006_9HYPH|nr:bifunctional adenosylcobinamide kinase/adenosylcobinamide-phosphate guanylyltransferase [Fulvimarina pelagi]EAU40435.1 adenosylcobinamide kinase [Fulvimarina pelagi HTCC2506]BAT31465.1 adenosylcobinamide kinase [Fulvimarina pelagi]